MIRSTADEQVTPIHSAQHTGIWSSALHRYLCQDLATFAHAHDRVRKGNCHPDAVFRIKADAIWCIAAQVSKYPPIGEPPFLIYVKSCQAKRECFSNDECSTIWCDNAAVRAMQVIRRDCNHPLVRNRNDTCWPGRFTIEIIKSDIAYVGAAQMINDHVVALPQVNVRQFGMHH